MAAICSRALRRSGFGAVAPPANPRRSAPERGAAGRAGSSVRCLGNTTCLGGPAAERGLCVRAEPHAPARWSTTCEGDTVCSLGRCVSPSCAAGETHASATGCLFYIAILDNVASDDDKPTLIVVTNPGPDERDGEAAESAPARPAPGATPVTIAIPAGHAASFTAVKPVVEASPPGVSAAGSATGAPGGQRRAGHGDDGRERRRRQYGLPAARARWCCRRTRWEPAT